MTCPQGQLIDNSLDLRKGLANSTVASSQYQPSPASTTSSHLLLTFAVKNPRFQPFSAFWVSILDTIDCFLSRLARAQPFRADFTTRRPFTHPNSRSNLLKISYSPPQSQPKSSRHSYRRPSTLSSNRLRVYRSICPHQHHHRPVHLSACNLNVSILSHAQLPSRSSPPSLSSSIADTAIAAVAVVILVHSPPRPPKALALLQHLSLLAHPPTFLPLTTTLHTSSFLSSTNTIPHRGNNSPSGRPPIDSSSPSSFPVSQYPGAVHSATPAAAHQTAYPTSTHKIDPVPIFHSLPWTIFCST
jgi:hypothetical protein